MGWWGWGGWWNHPGRKNKTTKNMKPRRQKNIYKNSLFTYNQSKALTCLSDVYLHHVTQCIWTKYPFTLQTHSCQQSHCVQLRQLVSLAFSSSASLLCQWLLSFPSASGPVKIIIQKCQNMTQTCMSECYTEMPHQSPQKRSPALTYFRCRPVHANQSFLNLKVVTLVRSCWRSVNKNIMLQSYFPVQCHHCHHYHSHHCHSHHCHSHHCHSHHSVTIVTFTTLSPLSLSPFCHQCHSHLCHHCHSVTTVTLTSVTPHCHFHHCHSRHSVTNVTLTSVTLTIVSVTTVTLPIVSLPTVTLTIVCLITVTITTVTNFLPTKPIDVHKHQHSCKHNVAYLLWYLLLLVCNLVVQTTVLLWDHHLRQAFFFCLLPCQLFADVYLLQSSLFHHSALKQRAQFCCYGEREYTHLEAFSPYTQMTIPSVHKCITWYPDYTWRSIVTIHTREHFHSTHKGVSFYIWWSVFTIEYLHYYILRHILTMTVYTVSLSTVLTN